MSTVRLQEVAYGLAAAPLLCLSTLAYAGDLGPRDRAFSQIGFAMAAAKACPKVKFSADGIRELAASLDAEDQAAVFTTPSRAEFEAREAQKSFALAGDRACDIAVDYMEKSKFKLLVPAN